MPLHECGARYAHDRFAHGQHHFHVGAVTHQQLRRFGITLGWVQHHFDIDRARLFLHSDDVGRHAAHGAGERLLG